MKKAQTDRSLVHAVVKVVNHLGDDVAELFRH